MAAIIRNLPARNLASAGAWIAALAVACVSIPSPARAAEPIVRTLRFTASTEDFPNPERGFYRYRELSAAVDFDVRKDGNSVVFLKLRADPFRDAPLDKAFLDRFQAACDGARKAGVKIIPRVAYNDGPEAGCAAMYGCDAPKAVVMGHIAQLAPLWKRNRDVIDLVDPGFIGGWGEWHTSSNGLDNIKDMTDILFAILDSLPGDRMVYVRYPRLKREMFAGDGLSDAKVLTAASAFDGSRASRIGHLNDCYLSGPDDVGTYKDFDHGWSRSRETAFIGSESRFTPMGGETCAVADQGACGNSLAEMAAMHIDHLNRDFHADVIQRWKDQGCYDGIARRLGYRFIADSARLPDSVRPGGVLEFSFALRNDGFGELFNPRSVEVTLAPSAASIAAAAPEIRAAVLSMDPRLWSGGTAVERTVRLSIPAGLPEGIYTIGLRLPDRDPSLAADPRYAVRFANEGMWNPGTGINEFKRDLAVSARAPGSDDPAFTRFAEIGTGVGLRILERPYRSGATGGRNRGAAGIRYRRPGSGGGSADVDARGRQSLRSAVRK